MQRPLSDRVLAQSLLTLALVAGLGCNKEEGDSAKTDEAADSGAANSPDKAVSSAPPQPAERPVTDTSDAAPADSGPANDTAGPGDGAAAGTTGTTGGDAAPPVEDPIPALLETAKSLDTEDSAAIAALDSAKAAGAAKLDLAKLANTRGEELVAKSEAERAEQFFVWARDNHTTFAEPSFNLAKIAALAGDVEVAKEHLLEVQKRGNKKLLKKVGVDPVFTILHDDPDVQKMYEP